MLSCQTKTQNKMKCSPIMTERCQRKFTDKIINQNYVIYIGILGVSVAALCIYRFLFTTIVVSYVLGCLACYIILKLSFLRTYLEELKRNHVETRFRSDTKHVLRKGCVTCGSQECIRHDGSVPVEPWAGLRIHKQLDQAIEEFYNTILEQFICTWYNKITPQPFFVDELRHQLRYASSILLTRALNVNYSRFITERLLPCALRHYTVCSDLSERASPLDSKLAVHPAAANRNAELKYLRCVTNAIMPYLLKHQDVQNSVFRVLIREIFAGWVLLSLTDVLADPHILNMLVILATGDETMAELPTTPNYRVEFLETFVRQTDSVYTRRSQLLRVDLDLALSDQDYFYSFMQFMKSTSHIHLLQFYKDIKSFQTKLLNPELRPSEELALINDAWDMYVTYFDPASPSCVHLDPSLPHEMRALLNETHGSIKKLQTSRALYQAARQSHAALEKIMLPRFLHSEEFYKLVIGSRIPTGYHKQMTKKTQENLVHQALKLGNRLRGALKSQMLDGHILDSSNDLDSVDNMDILKYLDGIASEDSLREQDLSTYKVVLTHVETRLQAPPRRGTVRYFTIAVHRVDPLRSAASFWSVERSEHDFHLLRSKLHEFHGDGLLLHLPLPSRRDNSPMETLRYKYEDFLQRLLQESLLQTSELLHLFLTVEGDFSLVAQASSLAASSTDLANIYQSVTHKLRKEKGQHLENFLRNFLISSDVERYQALKLVTAHVEEGVEVNEEVLEQDVSVSRAERRPRDITAGGTFRNNFDTVPLVDWTRDRTPQDSLVGFTQCLVYLLHKIVKAPAFIVGIVGSVLSLSRELVDQLFNTFLDSQLRSLLTEQRLAHLIRLGNAVLFGNRPSLRLEPGSARSQARRQLLGRVPLCASVIAPGLRPALAHAMDTLQLAHCNKQLVYNLLDLCILELFPELDTLETEEPKS